MSTNEPAAQDQTVADDDPTMSLAPLTPETREQLTTQVRQYHFRNGESE